MKDWDEISRISRNHASVSKNERSNLPTLLCKSTVSPNNETTSINSNANADYEESKLFPPKRSKNMSFTSDKIKTKAQSSETIKQKLSITYEEIGLFPRSFNRVFDRFFKQVFSDVENLVIQEYRFYRYLFLTTVKCLFILIVVPFVVHFISKIYFVRPIIEYYWNSQQTEIFLNSHQQKSAFSELQDFEEKLYFETLVSQTELPGKNKKSFAAPAISDKVGQNEQLSKGIFETGKGLSDASSGHRLNEKQTRESSLIRTFSPGFSFETLHFNENSRRNSFLNSVDLESLPLQIENSSPIFDGIQRLPTPPKSNIPKEEMENQEELRSKVKQSLQQKTSELALRYNDQSIEAITNFFADLISFVTLCFLFFRLSIQINITKSFLLEVFFGLDDSKKSLLILFITDLSVGYHSPNIWELVFQFFFFHYGIPESETTIFLLVATLPVLLDVLFKYLIFRHLNRSSPATVATYHAMIE